MNKKPAATIVVPTWNGVEFLGECLDSLQQQSAPCRIVVVDNGSTDGTQELLRKHYPNVKLIQLDRNYGFAGGVNRGIEYALSEKTEYIALFNNDAVADREWLQRLLGAAIKHPDAGIITGKLLNFAGTQFDSTGDCYSIWGFPYPRGRDEADRGQYKTGEYVCSGTGGASLYRAAMLNQVGLFDESFFAYYEDVDLSLRAQLQNWKVYYQPTAVARHRTGSTSSKISGFARYHSIKNFFYLYLKNMPGSLFWRYLPRFAVAALLMLANSVKRGQLGPLARGYGQVLLQLPHMLMQRWRIQHSRTVSTAYFDGLLLHRMPPTQKALLRLRRRITGGRA